ncbi:MAG: futalosine hydrolase [Bacteroidota bacterium]
MHILLLSATPFEIQPTVEWLRARAITETGNLLDFGHLKVEVLFTGVGQMATAYTLGRRFGSASIPQLAIQAGVGGAIDPKLKLGEVVRITSERLGDLGAENQQQEHLSMGEIGLFPGLPFDQREVLSLPDGYPSLPFPECAGLTVNRVNGSAVGIAKMRTRFPEAQVESMEGAAFFYACLLQGIEPLQLRSISNYVAPRNREAWKLAEAIQSLNEQLQQVLTSFIAPANKEAITRD